jgi:hypothetical protein
VYSFDGNTIGEKPIAERDVPNQGHPGAMLSLSANGDRDGILWSAIHATGDSWHESRPGILHAYDADDIRHELWNSLQNSARDDCGEYSKMAPPTIANGKVYLPSFGLENVGSGQFYVYGLLPASGATKPLAPGGIMVSVARGNLTLTWNAVPGAKFYRVIRSTTLESQEKIIAMGLTSPRFTEPALQRGESASYTVLAISSNGVSDEAKHVTYTSPKPKPMED